MVQGYDEEMLAYIYNNNFRDTVYLDSSGTYYDLQSEFNTDNPRLSGSVSNETEGLNGTNNAYSKIKKSNPKKKSHIKTNKQNHPAPMATS